MEMDGIILPNERALRWGALDDGELGTAVAEAPSAVTDLVKALEPCWERSSF